MKEIDKTLSEAGVQPTAVRKLVYQSLLKSVNPMSLSDLETVLETVDKSTIFRTLTTLKDHHLLHSFNDGSGSLKYEVCKDHSQESHEDEHVHFRCVRCNETYCLTALKVPEITLPEGYSALETNFIITGVCRNCSER